MSSRASVAKRFSNYIEYIQSRNRKTRALYLLSIFGILLFLTIAITLPFKDQVLNTLYPKPFQYAEEDTQTTRLSLTPAITSNIVGTTQDAGVQIDTQNIVTNADIALTFNPQILEVVSVTPGTFLPGAQEVRKTIDNTNGKLFYSLFTNSANAKSGTGTLVTIRFRAKAAGNSTVSFNPTTTIVYAAGHGNTIASNGLSSAIYTVTAVPNPTATPTTPPGVPTATPTNAPPTPTPTGGVGGVNATTHLALVPISVSKTVGATQDTVVRIETQNTVTNADIALTFNPQILEVISVSPGTFLPGATKVHEIIDNANGNVFYSLYTDTANAGSGTGSLVIVSFRARGAGSSVINFDPTTTIVYGTGQGNTIATNGLGTATYTVTAITNPTPTTPPSVPTATPTNAPLTPTPTLAPQPCALQSAAWSTTTAGNGEQVTLRVTTNGSASCTGKQVSFDIHENDSLIEGGFDDAVTSNPAIGDITGTVVTSTWIAEWQNDCGGFCNPNEFYFNAQIVNQSGSSIRSSDPYLTISETSTPIYIALVTLPDIVAAQSISNVQFTITSSHGTINKSISLIPTSALGVYQGSLPILVDPGNYTISVKLPGYFKKSFAASITNTPTTLNFTNVLLIAGDINDDKIINTLDIGQAIEEYAPNGSSNAASDITFDSKVNALDLGLIIENYFKVGE